MESIKVFEGNTLAAGATVARVSRLYVPSWTLFDVYKDIEIGRYSAARMAISYAEAMPIAVALYLPNWRMTAPTATVMAFCRKSWRRQGKATACVMALSLPRQIHASIGTEGSEALWNKCRISQVTYV